MTAHLRLPFLSGGAPSVPLASPDLLSRFQGAGGVVEQLVDLETPRDQLLPVAVVDDDLQVGPAAKLSGAKIVYSSNPSLRVLTSGRKLKGGWRQLYRYLRYRLHYNLKATPTRKHDVTRTSWDGFNQETSRRELINVPKKGEVSGSDK